LTGDDTVHWAAIMATIAQRDEATVVAGAVRPMALQFEADGIRRAIMCAERAG